MHAQGCTVLEATCELANSVAGTAILAFSAQARGEVLAYMRLPDVNAALMRIAPADSLMFADLIDGPGASGSAAHQAALGELLRRDILARAADLPLSQEARVLFVGVRHLWQRAVVAINRERDNQALRRSTTRLLNDSIYALEGASDSRRHELHLSQLLDDLIASPDEPLAPAQGARDSGGA
jgi:hypothetical protein